ncbi:kinase domain protein (macronuclear) [Tetrahymena thermophila SB210]|uniref:Kinase domain protein n=1 Tax=Tetrahymena thermophila (strain SB210) TaxID=312017 RepID=I7LX43_TETTS|nr:kinase domain protein [Tetrahymena thermophila SB210]EAS03732.2 kinase domain protein [Tetrahymena thermophila SB210]|eukprot:XP_001023977.2 kinase domain protein [Tetrahymena thermophila SB210]
MGSLFSKKKKPVQNQEKYIDEIVQEADENYNLLDLLNLLKKFEQQYYQYNFYKKDFPFLLIQVQNKNTNSNSLLKVIEWKNANISDINFLRNQDLYQGKQVIDHIILPLDQFFLIESGSIRNESENYQIFSDINKLKELKGFIVLEYDFDEYTTRFQLEQTISEEQLKGMYSIAIQINHKQYGSYQGQTPSLCEQLGLCKNLEQLSLDLRTIGLQKEGILELGNSICECQKIKNLKILLQSNKLEIACLSGLLSKIEQLNFLEELILFLGCTRLNYTAGSQLGQAITKCPNLKKLELDLILNQLDTQGCQDLANGLSKCSMLQNLILELRANSIKIEGLNYLADGISKCKNLEHLNLKLDKNGISGSLNQLGERIFMLKNLITFNLSLETNNIKSGIFHVLQGLAQSNKITDIAIRLNENQISDDEVKDLGFVNCQNLNRFILLMSKNQITSKFFKVFGKEIGYCKNIQYLQLEFNQINLKYDAIEFLSQGVSQLKSLNILKLSLDYNYINDTSDSNSQTQSRFLGISDLQKLQELKVEISQNNLSQKAIIQISEEISSCQQLQELYLKMNQIKNFNDVANVFIANITKCCQLKKLSFLSVDNKITTDQAEEIGQSLSKFQKLENLTLILSQNNILGKGSALLTEGISKSLTIKKLVLHLDNNQLNGELIDTFSENISNLKNLKILVLNIGGNSIDHNSLLLLAKHLSQTQYLFYLEIVVSQGRANRKNLRSLFKAKRLLSINGTFKI